MSCSHPSIDDLEDLAADLFEFQDDERSSKPKKEKALKKKKLQKVDQQLQQKTQPQTTQQYEPLLSKFFIIKGEKAPGTHNIFVKTFGCSHNISDSEFMVGQLSDYGYHMVDNPEDADLVLINSCTVVNPSQTAFINMVCKAKKIKKPIVVAGCVPQGQQGIPELQNVSAVGVTQIDRIVQVVQQTLKGHKVQLMTKKELPSLDLPKVRKSKQIEMQILVQDSIPINAGCLGSCTYCKTVFARGKLLSYTPEALVRRVNTVVKEGVRELWLTSEDTGAYGRDINTNISELLISFCEELQNHDQIMMRVLYQLIQIGMTNPPYILEHLRTIAHFLNHPRVFAFIHIPVQAGHNNVLTKMNREYPVQDFTKICDYFLEHCPDVTIATDIICGFAEETDEEFQGSLDLIEKYKFRVVNINQFYLRPGTPAANLKQIPSQIVKSRSSKLTQLFKSYDKHGYMMGREERVWINETQVHKGVQFLVGHTKNYTKVIIPYEQQLKKQICHNLSTIVKMKITKCLDWHIEGQIIERNVKPEPVPADYVQKMKTDLEEEKELIKKNKEQKLKKLKAKKQSSVQKSSLTPTPLQQQTAKVEQQQAKKEEVVQQKTIQKTQLVKKQSTLRELPIPTKELTGQVKVSPRYQFLIGFVALLVLGGVMMAMGY